MYLSELTLSLLAVGGVLLAGLTLHSVWQARRAAPRRADPQIPQEPVMHTPTSGDSSPTTAEAPAAFESQPLAGVTPGSILGGEFAAIAEAMASICAPKQPRYVARIDGLIDAIVPITLEAPLTGETLLLHMPTSRRAGHKPFLVEGLNEDTGQWEQPLSGAQYKELQAGIQLANRHGALNEIEFSEFVQKIEALAQPIAGMTNFPDMLDAVSRARELDTFASEHDAQLAIHLRARATAWSVGYIQQHASRQGFVGVFSGRMVLPSAEEGAPPVLTLQFDPQAALADDPNQAALRTITLNFDVPQTDLDATPFEQWQQRAEALAQSMEAHVVDDHGRTLNEAGFAAISKELDWLYKALEERGVPAGSMAARRLFS